MNIFGDLLGLSGGFMPHGHCYLWEPTLVWAHICADATIAATYYSIPIVLLLFVRRRQDLPFNSIFIWFAAFIVSCGTTHALSVWNVYHGAYWLDGAVKIVTAAISLVTALKLVRLLPVAIALPGPGALRRINAELEIEIGNRTRVEGELRGLNQDLEHRVRARTSELEQVNSKLKAEIEERAIVNQERDQLAMIVQSSNYAVIGKTPTGIITSWNGAAERMFGYSASEIIGQSMESIIPAVRIEEEGEILNRIALGERIESLETVRIHKSGSPVDVLLSAFPIRDRDATIIGAASIAVDISERKLAEKKLNESEARFRAFMDFNPAAAWVTDSTGIITYASPAYVRTFSVGDPTGRSLLDVYPRELAEQYLRNNDAVIVSESPIESIEERIRADGSEGRFLVYKFPIVGIDGEVRVGGTAMDITDRERAQAIVRESEQKLNVVLENLEEGLLLVDETGRILYWNPASLRMHDWSSPEEAELHLQDVASVFSVSTLSGKELPLEEWPLSRILRGEQVHGCEVRVSRRDRSWTRIFGCSGTIAHYGGGKMVAFLSLTDLTAAKHAEAVQLAILGAEIGTWHWDIESGEIRWSDRCKAIFGFNSGGAITNELFMRSLHPEDRDRVASAMRASLRDRSIYDVEMRCVWPDGSIHWVNSKGLAYYSPDGRAMRMEGVSLDITKQKDAENAVHSLNVDLAQQARQTEEANRELESFSYSVSHDLRAPLRHIEGYVELLARHVQASLDEKGAHYIRTVTETVTEMGALIDNLLAFSQMGRVDMTMVPVELTPLVAKIVSDFQSGEESERLQWKVGDLPVVMGDAALLKQVFINLISNSVKYSRSKNPAIIEIWNEGNTDRDVTIAIRDNGAGFDMRYVEKLFGVFQRLHHADEFEGTGIGLANVRRIIARHGGNVWAEGKVGEGATFHLTLQRVVAG